MNTQILTLHVTRHKGMFVKQIKYRCECVQEWTKLCGVFSKVLGIYTFPDNWVNTLT